MKNCENCGSLHNEEYGSGRFCSIKCARGFATKTNREELNKKVSETLFNKGPGKIKLICQNCKEEFEIKWRKRNQKACSRSCSAELKWKTPGYKEKIAKKNSRIAKNRHLNNDPTFGWQTRKKLEPSYPESIAIKTLDILGVNYEYEWKFGKYFADFALHENKVVIEIDGQQHNKPERKSVDIKKDAKLKSKGWKVYRIKWPEDNIIEAITNIINTI